jgi:hypothetical protein
MASRAQGFIILAGQEALVHYFAAKAAFLEGIFVVGRSPTTKIPAKKAALAAK